MPPVFIIKDFGNSIAAEAKRLSAGAKAVNELLPVMIRIGEDMMRIEKIVFSSQGRRGGGQWKKLKPETVKRKGSNVILVDTGTLETSLTEPNAKFQILNTTRSGLEFGTSDPVAVFHDEGRGNNPRRPLFKFVAGDQKRWNKMITDALMRPHRV